MIAYARLALALVQLANLFAGWARERGQIKAGEDAALGRAAIDLLRATEWGREIGAKIDAMDKPALDALADALGGGDAGAGR